MGLESRDWFREQPEDVADSTPWLRWMVIVGAAVATGVIAVLGAHILYGRQATYGGENVNHGRNVAISLLPGGPKLSLSRAWLYPPDDPWTHYLASEKTCPNGERTDL